MSYVVYNGKMVQSGAKYLGYSPLPGQIYLLQSGDGVEFGSVPSISGTRTVKMDLNLDSSTSSKFSLGFYSAGTDYLYAIYDYLPPLEQSILGIPYPVLRVQTANSPSVHVRIYNLDDYIGANFSLEIIKGTSTITSVKADNNTLTSLANGLYDTVLGEAKELAGAGGTSVWNLEIVGSHKWIGYPFGNQNSAWSDTVGTNDGTITGSPQTRNLL